jgi:iron complex transport system ATP-binding protein
VILEARGLAFSYGKTGGLFRNVSFSLGRGKLMSIIGPNGAGKSTLLNCLMNLLTPNKGSVFLRGRPLAEMDVRETARAIGYVPQIHVPVYSYSVRDFVVMGRTPYLGSFQQPGRRDYALVDAALEELGIERLRERAYTELSGGERQQVLIARAIVQQPEIVILDEPTSYLDYGNQQRILRLIERMTDKGYTVIMTTHVPDHVIRLGGLAGILDGNGDFTVGQAELLLTSERLSGLYNSDIRLIYVPEAGRAVCVAAR